MENDITIPFGIQVPEPSDRAPYLGRGIDLPTFGGRMSVRWDPDARVTSVAGLAHFGAFLANVGLFDRMAEDAPFDYRSNNACSKRDILGTAVLGVLLGKTRYVHINELRHDNAAKALLALDDPPDLVAFRERLHPPCARHGRGVLLVETYGIDPGRITVIHHGHEAGDPSVGKNPFPGMQYLLYVGARSGYKNFALFSRAAARIMSERKDLHLICTHGALTDDVRRPFAQAGVSDRVHAAFVDESDLYHLYANAELFVYPSKQEGFGMPIVDAFAAGCPVLLANASCFPEVGGDAAAYFDPDDEVQLGQLVKHIMDDAAMRSAMVKLGKVRAKCFDWGVISRLSARLSGESVAWATDFLV